MLDQIGEDRQGQPVFIRCHQLSGRIAQVNAIAERNGRRYTDASALKNMDVHRLRPFLLNSQTLFINLII